MSGEQTSNAGVDAQCVATLKEMLMAKKELEEVDMSARLAQAGLDKMFPVSVWPPAMAVRELETRIKARGKSGNHRPFVFADLKR